MATIWVNLVQPVLLYYFQVAKVLSFYMTGSFDGAVRQERGGLNVRCQGRQHFFATFTYRHGHLGHDCFKPSLHSSMESAVTKASLAAHSIFFLSVIHCHGWLRPSP